MPQTSSSPITYNDDIIDSRDVIARIDELNSRPKTAEEMDELGDLLGLAAEGRDAEDWEYGATLVRDSYFETYAAELADDIGAIDANAAWPMNYIDWKAAARALKMDYTAVDFAGVTYWVR